MDPLSITLGVLTLLKTCYVVGTGLKELYDAGAFVDIKVKALLIEVESFTQVTEMLKNTLDQDQVRESLHATGHIGTHWNSLATSLVDCQTTLVQLQNTLDKANKTTRVLDGPRKHYRLKAASDEIAVFQQQIRSYRDTLQLSLQTVILWNQVTAKTSTDQILPNLDELHQAIRRIAFDISNRMTSLENSVETTRESQLQKLENLRTCVKSAATVVSSASTALGIENEYGGGGDYHGSDFGDCFPPTRNESMQRWISSNTVYEFETESSTTQSALKGKEKLQGSLEEVNEGSDSERTDSDDELEFDMVLSLFKKAQSKYHSEEFEEAERLTRICSTRLSTLTVAPRRAAAQKEKIQSLFFLIYSKQKRWDEVSKVLLDRIASNDHPKGSLQAVKQLITLASILFKQEAYTESLLYGRKALRGYRKLGPEGVAGTSDTLTLLIGICNAMGDIDEADAYSALLIDHREKIKSEENDQISTSPDITGNSNDVEGVRDAPNPEFSTLDSLPTSRVTVGESQNSNALGKSTATSSYPSQVGALTMSNAPSSVSDIVNPLDKLSFDTRRAEQATVPPLPNLPPYSSPRILHLKEFSREPRQSNPVPSRSYAASQRSEGSQGHDSSRGQTLLPETESVARTHSPTELQLVYDPKTGDFVSETNIKVRESQERVLDLIGSLQLCLKKQDLQKQVLVVGDSKCGKAILMKAMGAWEGSYYAKIPNGFSCLAYEWIHETRVSLQFSRSDKDHDRTWNMGHRSELPSPDLILICFDVADIESLNNATNKWVATMSHEMPGIPYILVGLKGDLRSRPAIAELGSNKRLVRQVQCKEMSEKIGALCYVECSAQTGEGVREVFLTIALRLAEIRQRELAAEKEARRKEFWGKFSKAATRFQLGDASQSG